MKTVTLIENKEKGDYVIINDGKTTSLAPVKAFLDRDDICDFSVSALVADVKTGKLENVIINAIAYKRSMDEFLSMLNANDTSEFVIDNYSRNMLEQALSGARKMVERYTEPEEQDNKSGDPCGEDGKNGDDVAGQVPDVEKREIKPSKSIRSSCISVTRKLM